MTILTAVALLSLTTVVAGMELRHALGRKRANDAWRRAPVDELAGVGSTRSLAILPLVDWFPGDPDLRGEAGVSYLVRTDCNTILMDVGLNLGRSDPSPLLHNMRQLGVSLGDIDTIVISHRHADHVGGLRWLRRRTFSLGNEQPALEGKRVFVPEPMTYSGADVHVTPQPTVIAPGVATIGAIRAQIYVGRIDEQALAIRVEGKGVVLVVGCGHQSLSRILTRTAYLFDDPIYGVVGGLHYPLPRGRLRTLGLDLQNLLVYGPLRGPSLTDLRRDIGFLAAERPGWVSLSAHDSSDEAIDEFRAEFGARYHDLRVGQWQDIAPRAAERQPARVVA